MTKTKNALIASAVTILICITLLIGTTFAWFQSTAQLTVNKIESGTLDVKIEKFNGKSWEDAEGQVLNFSNGSSSEILYEPGASYSLPDLRITNNGSLSLKYKVVFSSVSGDITLAEVLDVYLNGSKVGTLKDVLTSTDPDGFAHGYLDGYTSTETLKISVKMQESADNSYQGKQITSVSVTVYAAQNTAEQDITGTLYDKDATYSGSLEGSFYEIHTDEDKTIDEGGKTINLNYEGGNTLASSNGSKVTLKNANYTGSAEAFYLGEYKGATADYNDDTYLENVNITNLEVTNGISHLNDKISSAVYCYGETELENCKITGTVTKAGDEYTPYDICFVNQSTGIARNCEFGSIYVFTQANVTLDNVKADKITTAAATHVSRAALVIKSGCEIGSIEITCYSHRTPALTIEEGASVGSITFNGVTYTQAQWANR